MLRAVALLLILPVAALCWLRVFNKSLREKYRPWWLKLARGEEEGDARLLDTFDLLLAWIAALLLSAIFIYIAGVGYWWK